MEDYIVRGTAAAGEIRAFAATTRNLVEHARQIHETSPVVTAALGRLLTAGGMMGSMMKGETDRLTLLIVGDGPVGKITVTADSAGNVKGYADNPVVLLHANEKHKLDVAGAVGHGFFKVIRDIGLKEPYIGQTDLVSGEIAEDITYYYAVSEQTPSSVGLGVLMNLDNTVAQAGGFILQLMPGASEETIVKLEENLKKVSSVTQLLSDGNTPEQILEILLEGLEPEIMDRLSTKFYCNCTENEDGNGSRAYRAVASLDKKTIAQMIEEDKPVSVHCHFCNRDTELSKDELMDILKKKMGIIE